MSLKLAAFVSDPFYQLYTLFDNFVLRKGDRLVAMEVKSADADSVSGMNEFKARHARAKPYLIGGQGMSPEMFFSCEADRFL